MEFKYLIAPIVTTIGILVSLILWLITFRRKEMSYEVLYDTPVLGVHDQITERMHIVYGGDTVDNVYLIMVKVINSGNVAVRAKDFDGKLAVQLPAGSRVLNAGVAESNPSNLNERSVKEGESSQDLIDSFGDARVNLRPVLLNRGDFITVKVLASRAEGPIAVSGHIEGVPSIKPQKDRSTFTFITANVGCVLMIAAVIFLDPNYFTKHLFKEGLPDVVLFLLGYGLFYTAIIMPRRHPRGLQQMKQLLLTLFFLAFCTPVLASEDMAVLQESKPLVTRAGAWHTWGDRIHLAARQEKLPLRLTFTNGAEGRPKATDLRVELNGKPLATFQDFKDSASFTIDLSGKLHSGNTSLTVKGFGPSGAWMNWKLYIQRPAIAAVKPDPISMKDTITIEGKNFSDRPDQVQIYIGKHPAKPLSSKEGAVTFKIPAHVEGGSQDLIVAVSSVKSAPFRVSVRPQPLITRVDMLASPPGQPVTLTGRDFSPVATENVVTFGKIKAHVVSATTSSITCIIPDMHFPRWHVPIVVTTFGMPSKGNAFIHVDMRVVVNEGIPMH